MYKDIKARGDIDDCRASRSWRADARQRQSRVDDTRRLVVRLLEDGDQRLNEAQKRFIGRRLVIDSVEECPQSVPASLLCSVRRLKLGTDRVEEHVDMRLCWSSLVDEHVTQQSKCALVDLITTHRNT